MYTTVNTYRYRKMRGEPCKTRVFMNPPRSDGGILMADYWDIYRYLIETYGRLLKFSSG